MIKISDTIREIIHGNPFLQFGISHGLMNLTQLARYLKPHIEVRTKKSVQVSAIVMNLSRMQNNLKRVLPEQVDFAIENITVHSNLCMYTFVNTPDIHKKINTIYQNISNHNGYITVTRAMHEVMIIVESTFLNLVETNVTTGLKKKNLGISAVAMKFAEYYQEIPGFFYHVFQQMILQNINVVEASSTFTEIILYVKEYDTKLTFDTLYQSFISKNVSV